jgi:hypothetical protein
MLSDGILIKTFEGNNPRIMTKLKIIKTTSHAIPSRSIPESTCMTLLPAKGNECGIRPRAASKNTGL